MKHLVLLHFVLLISSILLPIPVNIFPSLVHRPPFCFIKSYSSYEMYVHVRIVVIAC